MDIVDNTHRYDNACAYDDRKHLSVYTRKRNHCHHKSRKDSQTAYEGGRLIVHTAGVFGHVHGFDLKRQPANKRRQHKGCDHCHYKSNKCSRQHIPHYLVSKNYLNIPIFL